MYDQHLLAQVSDAVSNWKRSRRHSQTPPTSLSPPPLPSSCPFSHLEALHRRSFPGRELGRIWNLKRGGKIWRSFIMAPRWSYMSVLLSNGRKKSPMPMGRRAQTAAVTHNFCAPHTWTHERCVHPHGQKKRDREQLLCVTEFFSHYKHTPF